MTDQPPKPRRRWFQFSLRTLLIVVTLVAGLLLAWRVYVEPYRRQRETMKLIEELGGKYTLEPADKWLRWLYGDDFRNIVLVDVADCDEPEKYIEQVASLQKLETLVVGGRTFNDEHLSNLKRLATLSGLVLDSTSVTDDGVEALKQTLTELAIHKSQRRAIERFLEGARSGP